MKDSLFLSLGIYSVTKSHKIQDILDNLWEICEYKSVIIEDLEQLEQEHIDVLFIAGISAIQEGLNAFSKIKRKLGRYPTCILVPNQDLDLIESFIALPLSAGIQDIITFKDITNKNNANGVRKCILRAHYRALYIDNILSKNS